MFGRMCAEEAGASLGREPGIPHRQQKSHRANPPCGRSCARWPAAPTCQEVQAFSCLLKCQRTIYSPANKSPIIRYAMRPLYNVQVAGEVHNAVKSAITPFAAKKIHQTCVTRRV